MIVLIQRTPAGVTGSARWHGHFRVDDLRFSDHQVVFDNFGLINKLDGILLIQVLFRVRCDQYGELPHWAQASTGHHFRLSVCLLVNRMQECFNIFKFTLGFQSCVNQPTSI